MSSAKFFQMTTNFTARSDVIGSKGYLQYLLKVPLSVRLSLLTISTSRWILWGVLSGTFLLYSFFWVTRLWLALRQCPHESYRYPAIEQILLKFLQTLQKLQFLQEIFRFMSTEKVLKWVHCSNSTPCTPFQGLFKFSSYIYLIAQLCTYVCV